MSRTHQAAKHFVRLKTLKCSILKRSPSRYSYTYRLFKFLYCQVNWTNNARDHMYAEASGDGCAKRQSLLTKHKYIVKEAQARARTILLFLQQEQQVFLNIELLYKSYMNTKYIWAVHHEQWHTKFYAGSKRAVTGKQVSSNQYISNFRYLSMCCKKSG